MLDIMYGNLRLPAAVAFLVLAAASLIGSADAGCSSCDKASENWDPTAFLNSDITVPYGLGSQVKNDTPSDTVSGPQVVVPEYRSDPSLQAGMLREIADLSSSDAVLDVSSESSYIQSHIEGAAHLPARSFLNSSGYLKSMQEMASMLGSAGISRDDTVVVYGGSLESGDPTFAVWALQYLGQKDVRLLDGSMTDYSLAGLPVESGLSDRAPAEYIPELEDGLLASHDLLNEGSAQVIDARTFQDYGLGRVPGASFIDASGVLEGGKIASGDQLNSTFSGLSKDRPVIVYSDDGVRATLVWYALQLKGFDARLYTWRDWEAHGTAESAVRTGSNLTRPAAQDKDDGIYKRLG